MASVEVGECWLALGWYWSLVSQWFGSNGEAFIPIPVDPVEKEKELEKEKDPFLELSYGDEESSPLQRRVISDRKVEMCFEKKK